MSGSSFESFAWFRVARVPNDVHSRKFRPALGVLRMTRILSKSNHLAIVKRPFPGDPHCGDDAAWWRHDHKLTLCIVDGLGHGEDAERAARVAVEYIAHHLTEPLVELFAGCDQALRRTRGAAMSVAVIDGEAGTLTYAGIGNTRAVIVRKPGVDSPVGKIVRLSGNWGIVGGDYRKLTPETVELGPGDLVILTTDGVKERCDVSAYGDALYGDVQRLAERILRDCGREMDDVAVLVFRCEG